MIPERRVQYSRGFVSHAHIPMGLGIKLLMVFYHTVLFQTSVFQSPALEYKYGLSEFKNY